MNTMELVLTLAVAVLAVVNTWLMFMVQTFRADITALRTKDTLLSARVAEVHVLVAGQYVKREEFHSSISDLRDQTRLILGRMTEISNHFGGEARGD